MSRYSKSQLNAISRSYTERARAKAEKTLDEHFCIKFEKFCEDTGYAGSPCRLLTDIRYKRETTIGNVMEYLNIDRDTMKGMLEADRISM